MVIKMTTLPTPPPLTEHIEMTCVDTYTEKYFQTIVDGLLDSVTGSGLQSMTPCGLAALYVTAGMLQEVFRRMASGVGLVPSDLDTATKHAWPEFLTKLEQSAHSTIKPGADPSQN